jgi:hypothetical protein
MRQGAFSGGCLKYKKRRTMCFLLWSAEKKSQIAGHKHQYHKKSISIYSAEGKKEEGRERQQNKIMIESRII